MIDFSNRTENLNSNTYPTVSSRRQDTKQWLTHKRPENEFNAPILLQISEAIHINILFIAFHEFSADFVSFWKEQVWAGAVHFSLHGSADTLKLSFNGTARQYMVVL